MGGRTPATKISQSKALMTVRIELVPPPASKWLLTSRSFHFINEDPFNR